MTVFEQCNKFLLNGTLLHINNTPTDLSNSFYYVLFSLTPNALFDWNDVRYVESPWKIELQLWWNNKKP